MMIHTKKYFIKRCLEKLPEKTFLQILIQESIYQRTNVPLMGLIGFIKPAKLDSEYLKTLSPRLFYKKLTFFFNNFKVKKVINKKINYDKTEEGIRHCRFMTACKVSH